MWLQRRLPGTTKGAGAGAEQQCVHARCASVMTSTVSMRCHARSTAHAGQYTLRLRVSTTTCTNSYYDEGKTYQLLINGVPVFVEYVK